MKKAKFFSWLLLLSVLFTVTGCPPKPNNLGPGEILIKNISGSKPELPAKTMRFLVFNFGDRTLLVAAADITLQPGELKIATLDPKVAVRALVSLDVSQPILGADNRLNPLHQAGVEFGRMLEYDGVTAFIK